MKKFSLNFFFVISFIRLFAQNIFDEQNSKNFAYYLYKTQQYSLASQEYERLHFMKPQSVYYARLLLATYRLANREVDANKQFLNFSETLKNSPLIRKEYYNSLADLALYGSIFDDLTKNKVNIEQKKQKQLAALMLAQKYTRAELFYSTNNVQDKHYSNLQMEFTQLHMKKATMAAALSALLPGSGKVYAGEWKDGLVNLLFVGGNAYQAYRGFKKSGIDSAYGWLFGSLSFGFYLGNIYGAAKAAKYRNLHLQKRYYEKVYSVYRPYFR